MDVLPALAEMVEAGASADGDDKNSAVSVVMLALDLAAEGGIKVEAARCLVLDFVDNGDVIVHAVSDAAAARLREAAQGEGVESGTVAAADVDRAFDEAAHQEAAEGAAAERPSVPPAPPMAG